jgi:uncharacterized protein (DUF433 family)
MSTLSITPLASPLHIDEAGVVRVGPTRVILDTLVGSYRDGNTAEEIVQQFSSLSLADVHAAIAFYLTHVPEVEVYLQQRQADAADTRRRAQAACDQHGLRDRLLARQAARKPGP